MTEVLVNELRDEHKDREWVDAYGQHWAWIEDAWAWHVSPQDSAGTWGGEPPLWMVQWNKVDSGVENTRPSYRNYGPGPFMEAVHHRAVWGKDWKREW